MVGTVSLGTDAAQRLPGQFAGEKEPRRKPVSAFPKQARTIKPETPFTPCWWPASAALAVVSATMWLQGSLLLGLEQGHILSVP